MPIAAFKIGVLGDVETVAAVAEIVSDYPDLPVILDPVLASGRGDVFADDDTLLAIRELLIPQTTLITPNSYEARRLAAMDDGADAEALQDHDVARSRRGEADRMGCRRGARDRHARETASR